ncbi:MAG: DUF802 domain-containing protein [Comamonadaceae bacterium]|nr:DUF802 domain-containing protein [Comamonadaceae bacterium]
MNRLLPPAAFAAGLAALAWVGAGYAPGNPLALALVALIAVFYVVGAAELLRFRQASDGLARALGAADAPPPATLADWLATVPVALRDAVRLRVEGERVALPGPALTPYLTGLLVLLGMLGTFLGMVVTLQGTGLALENASDVDAIRASLAAPVRGLGLAFGTSVAGVAASAMLGLVSALLRRERQALLRRLDAATAGPLRGFSRGHQRERSLALLQAQADALPALVAQIGTLVERIERRDDALHERLLAGQARWQDDTGRAFAALAESVGRTLDGSVAEGARLAAGAIEPAVQATLAGLARESATLQATLADAVQRHLDASAGRLDATAAALGQRWQEALDAQQRQQERLAERQDAAAAESREQVQAMLALAQRHQESVAQRLDASAATLDERWQRTLAAQQRQHDDVAARLDATAASFADRWQATLEATRHHQDALAQRLDGDRRDAGRTLAADAGRAAAATRRHRRTAGRQRRRAGRALAGHAGDDAAPSGRRRAAAGRQRRGAGAELAAGAGRAARRGRRGDAAAGRGARALRRRLRAARRGAGRRPGRTRRIAAPPRGPAPGTPRSRASATPTTRCWPNCTPPSPARPTSASAPPTRC